MTTFALREPWRPSPWRNPPALLHQSTDNGALKDGRADQSARAVFVIEIRLSQSWRDAFVCPSMDDGSTNGMSRLCPAGAFPKSNLERASALLQQERCFTDVPNGQCDYWWAVRSKQEWQPRWSMSFESLLCDLFKLPHVSLWGAVPYGG